MIIKIKKQVETIETLEEFEVTGPFKENGYSPKYYLCIDEKTLITIIKPNENIFIHKLEPSQSDLSRLKTYEKISMEEFTQFLCEGLDEIADAIATLEPKK